MKTAVRTGLSALACALPVLIAAAVLSGEADRMSVIAIGLAVAAGAAFAWTGHRRRRVPCGAITRG